jgi:hypothetical protein
VCRCLTVAKNPPPEVRTITFFDFYPIQNVYPGHQVDIELLDGDHNGWKEPAGNDTEYEGVTSVEQVTPNPIDSSMLEQVPPSTIDQVDTTTPLDSGQKRKRAPPILRRKRSKPSANQVTTQIELPSYYGPQSSLDLVVVEIIFGRLFEPFRHASQAAGTKKPAGDDTYPPKKPCTPSFKHMLMRR